MGLQGPRQVVALAGAHQHLARQNPGAEPLVVGGKMNRIGDDGIGAHAQAGPRPQRPAGAGAPQGIAGGAAQRAAHASIGDEAHLPHRVHAVPLAGGRVGNERAEPHGEGLVARIGFKGDVLRAKIEIARVFQQRFQPGALLANQGLVVTVIFLEQRSGLTVFYHGRHARIGDARRLQAVEEGFVLGDVVRYRYPAVALGRVEGVGLARHHGTHRFDGARDQAGLKAGRVGGGDPGPEKALRV